MIAYDQFVHPAFQLLHETGRKRVPEIRTGWRGRFAIDPVPPLYPDNCGVVRDVFFQPFPPGSACNSVQQFSGMLIISFEEWRTPNAHIDDVCSWHLQVYPPDIEFMRALDVSASNGSIMDQLKEALNMLQEVPLVLGCAFVLRFGHRGAEYPYMEVEADFGFGVERIKAQEAQRIAAFDAHERKLGIRTWRAMQKLVGADTPQRPKPVDGIPDLWADNQHVKIVVARIESTLQSLVRRIEDRANIGRTMIAHNIDRAPGDHDTVCLAGEDAERGITAKQIRRTAGVTVYRPGAENAQDAHQPRREQSNGGMRPQGLGRAADSIAPPPPPRGVRAVVPDEGLAPASVQIFDPEEDFVDTRQARPPVPNLANRTKKR
jgi:hypothetical protein